MDAWSGAMGMQFMPYDLQQQQQLMMQQYQQQQMWQQQQWQQLQQQQQQQQWQDVNVSAARPQARAQPAQAAGSENQEARDRMIVQETRPKTVPNPVQATEERVHRPVQESRSKARRTPSPEYSIQENGDEEESVVYRPQTSDISDTEEGEWPYVEKLMSIYNINGLEPQYQRLGGVNSREKLVLPHRDWVMDYFLRYQLELTGTTGTDRYRQARLQVKPVELEFYPQKFFNPNKTYYSIKDQPWQSSAQEINEEIKCSSLFGISKRDEKYDLVKFKNKTIKEMETKGRQLIGILSHLDWFVESSVKILKVMEAVAGQKNVTDHELDDVVSMAREAQQLLGSTQKGILHAGEFAVDNVGQLVLMRRDGYLDRVKNKSDKKVSSSQCLKDTQIQQLRSSDMNTDRLFPEKVVTDCLGLVRQDLQTEVNLQLTKKLSYDLSAGRGRGRGTSRGQGGYRARGERGGFQSGRGYNKYDSYHENLREARDVPRGRASGFRRTSYSSYRGGRGGRGAGRGDKDKSQ